MKEADGSKRYCCLHPTRREGIASRELDMQGLNVCVTSRRLLKNVILEQSETRQRIC